jgi:hypothetical protein
MPKQQTLTNLQVSSAPNTCQRLAHIVSAGAARRARGSNCLRAPGGSGAPASRPRVPRTITVTVALRQSGGRARTWLPGPPVICRSGLLHTPIQYPLVNDVATRLQHWLIQETFPGGVPALSRFLNPRGRQVEPLLVQVWLVHGAPAFNCALLHCCYISAGRTFS